ncbi:MAG: DEAD/DEAH box helicase [Chitinophagaceae bacterium]
MNVSLRDYQINGIDDIINAWTDYKSILFQMPTGTGKTTLFCEIIRKFTTELYPDKKVLIITHRKELVEQVFDRLVSDFHLTSGIISSSFIGIQSAPIQVASIQTLVRREAHQKDIFSLVIIDEAHHALATTYRKLWNFYPDSKFLGVTATPIRTNGQGFHDLFDKLITTASIKWFIKNNHLSDIRYFASHTPDLSNIKIRAGDYDETELSEVMQDKAVMADLVQSYIDFANDKKMIVFAVNRAHSKKIVEKFYSSGFPTKSIDSLTPTDERQNIVDDFRKSKFKILCNVNIFTEGFDCPDVDAVQLARPTKSLTLFLQQVGRCMRPHQNKQYGIILDNAGLWKAHGLPKMDRNWTLNGTDKNICPSQKAIIGIKEISSRGNSGPQESKGIRLVEVGELDNVCTSNTINFNNIEENLIDKKILTMRERIEYLIKQIQKLEQRRANETDEDIQEIIDDKIKVLKKELFDLQEKLQPKRFEQVIELIIGKCQEMIDNNEIFVDGDKDVFLNRFVEPYLINSVDDNNIPDYLKRYTTGLKNPNSLVNKILNYIQTHDNVTWAHVKKVCVTEFGCTNEQSGSIGASLKTLQYHNKILVDGSGEDKRIRLNVIQNSQELIDSTIEGQIEIFHYFPKNKLKAVATFDPSSKKIIYNGVHNLSPSGAAMRATKDNNGSNPNLNGWIFWKYVDVNGNERTIDNLK